ncbi:MAG: hypothetical protein KC413_08545 [Anaerolineales bacterium]|nr:hypothetical protein [Anaerolineales bacterium]MCB8966578.1 hypothetical protein [Ardenticatenaceae bacterium]
MGDGLVLADDVLTAVAADVLSAWQRNHGTENGRAHTVVGPEEIVVVIEDAFSRGELALAAQQPDDPLFARYVQQLLQHVCTEQRARLAVATGRPVVSTGVTTDPAAGWAICFFKLGKR